MKALVYSLIASLTLWTVNSSAAICVGKNCDLLDSVAKKSGVSLQDVLDNVQGNIIDPVVDSQSKMATWEGGMLDFTPSGTSGGVKVTLWGSTSFDSIPVSGRFFGSSYDTVYSTGILRLGTSVEVPMGDSTDLIANGTFWYGPSDFGTGYIDGDSNETFVRAGLGIRHTLQRSSWHTFYLTSGLLGGTRKMKADFPGNTVNIKTAIGTVRWRGIESFEEVITFLSIPSTIGSSLSLWNLTASADLGLSLAGQLGRISVSKMGPVGPFFGESGFYNVGVVSDDAATQFVVWPTVRLGIEWKITSKMRMMGNWNPKLGQSPQHAAVGLGWQFMRLSNLESRRPL